MKRAAMVLGVVVVCLPMVFVIWLLAAAQSSRMDAMTVRMPEGMRAMVVQAVLGRSAEKASLERARRLDMDAVKAWQLQRSEVAQLIQTQQGPRTSPKMQELYRTQVENKKAAKALAVTARAAVQAGKACEAEHIYAEAEKLDGLYEMYQYEEGMGRAGLMCGHLPEARVNLERAIGKEVKFIRGTDEDQLTSVRDDLKADREFLVVVSDRQNQPSLAASACAEAHRGWKGCDCAIDRAENVKCEERR